LNKYVGEVIVLYEELEEIVSEKSTIIYDEIMANHTSFKIGGKADVFVVANSNEDLIQVIEYAKKNDISLFIIGNGSNLLVSDKGIRGVVIKLGDFFREVNVEGEYVIAGSACSINAVAQKALEGSLSGFEWAFGIPGSIGGAVFMNAGAYGGSMSDVVYETTYLDEEYNLCVLENTKHDFGYRKSVFKSGDIKGIILSTKLKLKNGDSKDIWDEMQKYINARIEKQPLNMPSAGSVFKRPDGYFAGKLIEDSGLKGFKVGGAQVSEKHAGFIVNLGDATANDVKELIKYIQNKVKENYNVELETEIMEVGE